MKVRTIVAMGMALLVALPVLAYEAEEPEKLAAVQKRKFRLDHEIFAAAVYQPLDAFYKGLGPEVSYTAHFSDLIGWEVIRGTYSFNFETKLREQLRKDFAVSPTKFDKLQWMVGTAAVLKPMYGKHSFLNYGVVHADLYFLLGASLGRFELGKADSNSYKPGPQAGAGLRFFVTESLSVRAEGRYHYLISRESTQIVDISLGLAVNLGGAD